MVRYSIPVTGRYFSLLQKVQAISESHPASHSTGRGCSLPEVKWPGPEVDHSTPPSTKFKNKWSYTSAPTYVFVICIEEILSSPHFSPTHTRNWSFSPPFPVFQRNYFNAFLISTMLGYVGGHEQDSGVHKGTEVFLWLLRSFALFSATQNLLHNIPNPELNWTSRGDMMPIVLRSPPSQPDFQIQFTASDSNLCMCVRAQLLYDLRSSQIYADRNCNLFFFACLCVLE